MGSKFKVGDKVHDDLTGKEARIVRIETDSLGNVGIWLDSEYLAGGRHPWEVSEFTNG